MSYYNPRMVGGALDAGAIPKTGLAAFLAVLLALACAGLAVGFAIFGGDVYEDIKRATVYIRVDGDTEGSGAVITEDGYVLTAAHVVKGGHCSKIEVVLDSGQKDAETLHATCTEHVGKPGKPTPAEIGKDYALLKVEAGRPLAFLPVTGSEDVTEGTKCFIAGFPMGSGLQTSVYGPNVSIEPGHIKAVMRGGEEGVVAFNTDARGVPGMSGGPCTNDRGEVIGLISMGSDAAAAHLILPTSRFKHVWEPLMR